MDTKHWNILIVDDDKDVHTITNLVVNDIAFSGKRIHTTSVYGYHEAIEALNTSTEFCIALIDVVMEEPKSGLDLVKYIRNELKNHKIRIILCTRQPGQTPEKTIIRDYDINDYKEKTELTSTKLYTSIIASIRSYRDISIIEEEQRGLQQIIETTRDILKYSSIKNLAGGILKNISLLTGHTQSSLIAYKQGGFIAQNEDNIQDSYITHGNGIFADSIGKSLAEVISSANLEEVCTVIKTKQDSFHDGIYISQINSTQETQHIIFFKAESPIQGYNQNTLELFRSNFTLAYNNLQLYEEVKEIQYEIIYKLAEIVETRSGETGQHVRRVSNHSNLLARLLDLPHETCELYKLASTMHDAGKIGISDSVLLKPEKLTNEEFNIIKTHTILGHNILTATKKPIFKTAAIIALSHHEHWNGNGYPNGIAGEDIPKAARIVAITDVFDALSHNRCYKDAWNNDKITQFFINESGKQFDPTICKVFIEHINEFFAINTHYDQRNNIL